MARLLASIARLHIVAIGAMGTLTFAWVLCGVRPVELALISAGHWFVVNLMNRVVDLREDEENGVVGTELVKRHQGRTIAVALVVLAVVLGYGLVWATPTVPVQLAFLGLGLVYNFRLLPGRRRLKELAFWKNTASATGFVLTCFLLPASAYPLLPSSTTTMVAVTIVWFFLFELSYEVLYDLRDTDGDRAAGVRSWPVLWGRPAASLLAVALMVTSFLVVVVGFVGGVLPWRVAVMGAAPLVQAIVVVGFLPDRVSSRLCIGLTWMGVLLLGTYHGWELLGLPGSGRS
jgi:4-hydroxybenzoate polyprenyltransferase